MNVRSNVQRAATAVRGALSFAHLAGVSASNAAEDDTEDKDKKAKKAADEDEQDKKDQASEDDKNCADDEPAKDKEKDASEGDGDDEDDKKDKAKAKSKAKGKADSDDDDTDMHADDVISKARLEERTRCASILGSKEAAGRVELAANLAFNTDLTAAQAISVMKGTPLSSASARASRNPNIGPGGAPAVDPKQAIASSWDKALAQTAVKR